jgi:hypothetical protein
MYSPLTVATDGGGVAVGGSGVEVGKEAVGVLGVPKIEAQAERPIPQIRISLIKNERGLKNIVRIIPT